MFASRSGLTMDGDHLDLSFRNLEAWPSVTPGGSIRNLSFDFGDAAVGARVELGLMTKVEGEEMDWKHMVDPVHHHGTDQFRVLIDGKWTVAGRPMPVGGYMFQESGWIYQEHPGEEHAAWFVLVLADRRGAASTLKANKNQDEMFPEGEIYGMALATGGAYEHPAGDQGVAAIATTIGPCERGYLSGRIDDVDDGGAVTGVAGDEVGGPVFHMLKAGPGAVATPAFTYTTEVCLVVAGGSCRIGADDYRAGDLRIQRAESPFEPIIAGPEGLEAVLMVGDRRARAVIADTTAAPVWMNQVDDVLADLVPVPGGAQAERRRAALSATGG
jgi:hypothetical protein